jgi:nitrous oxide reductase accessory protein NosL
MAMTFATGAFPLSAQGAPAPTVTIAPGNELEKCPKCPYCGMDRRRFHASRMLVQYSDGLLEGTCSLHCAAISLSLHVDQDPTGIWVGDNAGTGDPLPLVDVDRATFLVGSKLPGVMTATSKVAFGAAGAAKTAQAAQGGELLTFDQALQAAYTDMAKDVTRIRKMRAERRRRMQEAEKAPAAGAKP